MPRGTVPQNAKRAKPWTAARTEVASLTLLVDKALNELGKRASIAGLSKKTVKKILHDWHMRMHMWEENNKLDEA